MVEEEEVEEGEEEEGRRGDTVAAMGAGAEAQGADDAAGPAAGAALAPGADPATADPDPGHTLGPSPAPLRPRRQRTSPILVPDPDQNLCPNPSPGPEAALHPLKEPPGQDLKARPSLLQRMEENPRRTRLASDRFQTKTSDVQTWNSAQESLSCCQRFISGLSCFGFFSLFCHNRLF